MFQTGLQMANSPDLSPIENAWAIVYCIAKIVEKKDLKLCPIQEIAQN